MDRGLVSCDVMLYINPESGAMENTSQETAQRSKGQGEESRHDSLFIFCMLGKICTIQGKSYVI